jgi:hypothetical protein
MEKKPPKKEEEEMIDGCDIIGIIISCDKGDDDAQLEYFSGN